MSLKSGRSFNLKKIISTPWSLSARLTFWYSVSSFILFLITTGILYWFLENHLSRDADDFLNQKFSFIESIIDSTSDPISKLKEELEIEPRYQNSNRFFARIFSSDGKTLVETPGLREEFRGSIVSDFDELTKSTGQSHLIKSHSENYLQVLTRKSSKELKQYGPFVVQIAIDRTDEIDLLEDFRIGLGWVLIASLIISSGVGYWIAHKNMRPVEDIISTGARITSSTLHERIGLENLPTELKLLGATFNDMFDRLENSFSRISQFSADIAHELRTPLNNLRGEAEVGLSKKRSPEEYEQILGSCLEECSRLTAMIDSLFFLASAEDPKARVHRDILNINHELRTVCEFFEPIAQDTQLFLESELKENFTFNLDRPLFQRAMSNLLSNAFRYTKTGKIQVFARSNGGSLVIEVKDSGIGIPPEHLPYIFDRFYRVDPSRTSVSGNMGLGLSIVKSIMALHSGAVEIESTPQVGTVFRLIFPTITNS